MHSILRKLSAIFFCKVKTFHDHLTTYFFIIIFFFNVRPECLKQSKQIRHIISIPDLWYVLFQITKLTLNEYNFLKLVLLWAHLTKIYPPLPTSVQPISITKILLIVPTKNERDPPLFIGKLLIKFQNILRNTKVIIRHRVKILFSVISSSITLERQKWKSSKMKGTLLSSPVSCW
jgi:hypothetical protein